jgi:hypothetical protein
MKTTGWQRLAVPEVYAPFCEGQFSDGLGEMRVLFASLAAEGHDPLPTFVPPRESVGSNPQLAERFRWLSSAAGAQFPQLVVLALAELHWRGKTSARTYTRRRRCAACYGRSRPHR